MIIRVVFYLIIVLFNSFLFAQTETELCKRALDFCIADLEKESSIKGEFVFTGIVDPPTSFSFITPFLNRELKVDTTGLQVAFNNINDSIIRLNHVDYSNKRVVKKKRKKSNYTIYLKAPINYNSTSYFITIVIANDERSFLYLLLMNNQDIDSELHKIIW